MQDRVIKIKNIIKSSQATSPQKAMPFFSKMIEIIDSGDKVMLDFSDIDTVTTSFLNNSIGKLYSKYDSESLRKSIGIVPGTATQFQIDKIQMVVDNTKAKLSSSDIEEEID